MPLKEGPLCFGERTVELTPGRKRHTCVSFASPQILYFTNGHLYPTGSQAKRASLLQNPPTGGVATLKLTDVHPSDTGTYLCQVYNPPDFYTNGLGLINLTVLGKAGWGPTRHPCTTKDCSGPAKSAKSSLYRPPSPPHISISSPSIQLHWGPQRKMPPSQSLLI